MNILESYLKLGMKGDHSYDDFSKMNIILGVIEDALNERNSLFFEMCLQGDILACIEDMETYEDKESDENPSIRANDSYHAKQFKAHLYHLLSRIYELKAKEEKTYMNKKNIKVVEL